MTDFLKTYTFYFIFLCMVLWEWFAPLRLNLSVPYRRWFNHFVLFVANTFIRRGWKLLTGGAVISLGWQRGILSPFSTHQWVSVLLGVFAIDFVSYVLHRAFHKYRVLWRIHRIHHSDLELDVTTAFRNHPLEIIISISAGSAIALIVGIPVVALVTYGVLATSIQMFHHANIGLSPKADLLLGCLIVTPAMHCLHHSVNDSEYNSNYGIVFPWWDWITGTFLRGSWTKQKNLSFGLKQYQNSQLVGLPWIFTSPFIINQKRFQ